MKMYVEAYETSIKPLNFPFFSVFVIAAYVLFLSPKQVLPTYCTPPGTNNRRVSGSTKHLPYCKLSHLKLKFSYLALVVDCSWAVEVCLHLGHSRGDNKEDDMVCDA